MLPPFQPQTAVSSITAYSRVFEKRQQKPQKGQNKRKKSKNRGENRNYYFYFYRCL